MGKGRGAGRWGWGKGRGGVYVCEYGEMGIVVVEGRRKGRCEE